MSKGPQNGSRGRVGRLEDAEDELAISRYLVRRQLGEVEFISQAEARTRLGLHSS